MSKTAAARYSLPYYWDCLRYAHTRFTGRLGIFMYLFGFGILFSSNVITLHRFSLNQQIILSLLMIAGSAGELFGYDKRTKIIAVLPALFYFVYGVIISIVDFGLWTGAIIFAYVALEIIIHVAQGIE